MKLGQYELKAATNNGRTVLFCDREEPHAKVREFIFFTPKSERPRLTISKDMVEHHKLKRQADRDLKAYRDKDTIEPLFIQSFEQSVSNKLNGNSPYWVGVEMYWAGYARGVREQCQKERIKLAQRDNIGALTGNDMNDLAEALGISENKLVSACLELSAKRKGGY